MIKVQLSQIKLFLMDVDGVLTDGRIIYDDRKCETKEFNVRDGLGIRLLVNSGIFVGIITGRSSDALLHRCNDLGISYLMDSVINKCVALEKLLKKTAISMENTAFVGDDLPDLPIMTRVGFPIAVADADKEILKIAKLITFAKGGNGAIREVAELILKANGKWKHVTKSFYK